MKCQSSFTEFHTARIHFEKQYLSCRPNCPFREVYERLQTDVQAIVKILDENSSAQVVIAINTWAPGLRKNASGLDETVDAYITKGNEGKSRSKVARREAISDCPGVSDRPPDIKRKSRKRRQPGSPDSEAMNDCSSVSGEGSQERSKTITTEGPNSNASSDRIGVRYGAMGEADENQGDLPIVGASDGPGTERPSSLDRPDSRLEDICGGERVQLRSTAITSLYHSLPLSVTVSPGENITKGQAISSGPLPLNSPSQGDGDYNSSYQPSKYFERGGVKNRGWPSDPTSIPFLQPGQEPDYPGSFSLQPGQEPDSPGSGGFGENPTWLALCQQFGLGFNLLQPGQEPDIPGSSRFRGETTNSNMTNQTWF
ncbi:MAG: hypothetical protein M1840_000839 [Geoglossum simile]|nr:MAG: hypothetical protein M1840_000839 [Geoglossum simile]